MPQPLADIGDRIELLKMTLGMFAPEEPAPIAAELVELGTEIFEHWLIDRGEAAAVEISGPRLLALHAAAVFGEPSFAALAGACRELLRLRDLVMADPEHAETVERLVMAAAAAGDIYSGVTGRMTAGGSGNPPAGQR